ncbi:unnamed protein product [Diamesa hyperborea]
MLFNLINIRVNRKKTLVIIVFGILVAVSLWILAIKWFSPTTVCYFSNTLTDQKTLVNILEAEVQPSKGQNVFFHETSCSLDKVVEINARQACAIESAAKANPHHQVFVLFASPVGFRNTTTLPLIDSILSYKNVHLNYLNITQYAEQTPLEEWIKNGDLFRSTFLNSHTSDVLRFLTLWKYGGTYLDLDVVVRKPLDSIPLNYAGTESIYYVAVGILNMDQSFGHLIAHMCLKDLSKNFNGNNWGNNGPGVLTRVLRDICQTEEISLMNKAKCHGFSVLPVKDCYSIHWKEYPKFFEEQYLKEAMVQLNDSLIAHVWNKFTAKIPLLAKSKVAYIELAKEFCPKVIATVAALGVNF